MKHIFTSLLLLLSWQIEARSIEETSQFDAPNTKDDGCDEITIKADLCTVINTLFNLVDASQDDSNFGAVNDLLIPYKRDRCAMRLLLNARKTINNVQNTTPMHVAVQGNNIGITAIFFQKISAVSTSNSDYTDLSRSMANARDGDNMKPIDYTNDPTFINFLNAFTDP